MGFLGKILSKLFKPNKLGNEIEVKESFGIQMTDEEIEAEKIFNDEVLKILESRMIESGYLKKEKIPSIVEQLRCHSVPFGRVNTKVLFKGEIFLSVEEKKALGLNTRMKYSKEFIEYFNPSCFSDIEPKTAIEDMHLDAFHRMSRKRQILQFKQSRYIKKVRIKPDDCSHIKRLKKI